MNWRMIALAAALLLIVPVGIGTAQDPILDLWGEASAIIQDVELIEPPRKKTYNDSDFIEPEQLVEGHTVFVTIDLQPQYENVSAEVDIGGYVSCEHHVAYEAMLYVVPTNIREAQVECAFGERVVVTPDPFSGDPGSLDDTGALYTPTGQVFPFTVPGGQSGYLEELVFEHEGRDYLAWATPVLRPFETAQGTKNFYAPLPLAGLQANGGIRDYRVVFE